MHAPRGFSSWRSYFHFTMARDFVDARTYEPWKERNIGERIGNLLMKPIFQPLNFLAREIKNPLVIVALTTTLIAITTLVFYPTELMAVVGTVFPFAMKIRPWMVKFALFLTVEGTICAIGLRAFSRLCNERLVAAWHARSILPLHIGMKDKLHMD